MVEPYYKEENFMIFHGDCREIIPKLLEAGLLDALALTCTDPPYGINSVHKTDGKMGGSVAAPNKVYAPVIGDDGPMDVAQILSLPGRKIIWGAEHIATGIPPGGRLLVWDKRDGMKSNDFSDFEVAWDSERGASRLFRHRQVGMINDGYGDIGRVHPNQKPLSVMLWCLSFIEVDHVQRPLIFDPYMGSGSTLRAAKDSGCRGVGIEVSEEYCQIAADRLRQETIFEAIDQIRKQKQDKFEWQEQEGNGNEDGPCRPEEPGTAKTDDSSGQEGQAAQVAERGFDDAGDTSGRLRDFDGERPVLGGERQGNSSGGSRKDADASSQEVVDGSGRARAICPWD